MFFNTILLISSILFFSLLFYIFYNVNNYFYTFFLLKRKEQLYRNIDCILGILEYSKEEAYKKIFSDHIIVELGSSSKLKSEDVERYMREYIKLVIQITGPNIINDLVELYGNEETFYGHIGMNFINRLLDEEYTKNKSDEVDYEITGEN